MSKAFTRETDEIEPEEIRSVRPQLPPGTKNYITREGADRLRHRLDELLKNRRSATSPERRFDAAIRKLELILESIVIADDPVDPEKVGFGASVEVRYSNGEQEVYRIVGVDEADPTHDLISWIAPLAKALLNHRAGDEILFKSPAGDHELRILKVQYASE